MPCSWLQTSEKEQQRKELGLKKDAAEAAAASEEVLYKIDIPANRYDMLCLEGIARALNIFTGRLQRVDYRVADMTGACLACACPQRMHTRCKTHLFWGQWLACACPESL